MKRILQTLAATSVLAAAEAFAAGDCVGNKILEFTFDPADYVGNNGVITNIQAITPDGTTVADLKLILFNSNPSLSAVTNNAAPSIAPNDLDKIFAAVDVALAVPYTGALCVFGSVNTAIPFKLEPNPDGTSNNTIYAIVIADAATTIGAVNQAINFKLFAEIN